MAKTIFSRVLNIISVLIIVLAVAILLSAIFTRGEDTPSVMGYSFMKVLTGSMEPEIPTDSIVVTKEVDTATIKVGDVITYKSNDPQMRGVPVTHRVTEVDPAQGTFITKGDANVLEDKEPVLAQNVIGKVVFSSHILGVLIILISKPYVFFPLVIIPLLIIVIGNMRNTVRTARKIAKEEEEEAVKKMMEEIKNKRNV